MSKLIEKAADVLFGFGMLFLLLVYYSWFFVCGLVMNARRRARLTLKTANIANGALISHPTLSPVYVRILGVQEQRVICDISNKLEPPCFDVLEQTPSGALVFGVNPGVTAKRHAKAMVKELKSAYRQGIIETR